MRDGQPSDRTATYILKKLLVLLTFSTFLSQLAHPLAHLRFDHFLAHSTIYSKGMHLSLLQQVAQVYCTLLSHICPSLFYCSHGLPDIVLFWDLLIYGSDL